MTYYLSAKFGHGIYFACAPSRAMSVSIKEWVCCRWWICFWGWVNFHEVAWLAVVIGVSWKIPHPSPLPLALKPVNQKSPKSGIRLGKTWLWFFLTDKPQRRLTEMFLQKPDDGLSPKSGIRKRWKINRRRLKLGDSNQELCDLWAHSQH